jgi:hypothetical protein
MRVKDAQKPVVFLRFRMVNRRKKNSALMQPFAPVLCAFDDASGCIIFNQGTSILSTGRKGTASKVSMGIFLKREKEHA